MNRLAFIETIAPLAVKDYQRSGVLPSITIAQGILESDSGDRAPENNLFGIKGTGQEFHTTEYINGHFVGVVGSFRAYDSWVGSIIDHDDFLRENGRYARAGFFRACQAFDYIGAALALQSAGYATDPLYASKLVSIIKQHNLYDYDEMGRATIVDAWKQAIIDEALNRGLIKEQHNPDDPAPKWFVLQVIINEQDLNKK